MCQGYDIKLCIQKGSSSSSILVDLHFIFSGTAEDAAIMFVLLSTICGISFRCKHNVVLPVVCSQDHNTELVYNSVVIPFVNQ